MARPSAPPEGDERRVGRAAGAGRSGGAGAFVRARGAAAGSAWGLERRSHRARRRRLSGPRVRAAEALRPTAARDGDDAPADGRASWPPAAVAEVEESGWEDDRWGPLTVFLTVLT